MNTGTLTDAAQVKLLRQSALIAGFAILVMALTVPVVEFYIFPKLVNYKDPAQTVSNLVNDRALFSTAIFVHFVSVICDLVSGWALYIFLRPVNKNLALLSAWFRIVNAAFTIAALSNLVRVLIFLKAPGEFDNDILFSIRAFNLQWRFMLVFFGIYMVFLGYLVLRAAYVPKLIGIVVVMAGLGYIIENLKFFFYPGADTGYLWFTYFGELIFMLWLLIQGSRLKLQGRPNT